MTALVLADMSLSQPVVDRFQLFDYRDLFHLIRLSDRDRDRDWISAFPRL